MFRRPESTYPLPGITHAEMSFTLSTTEAGRSNECYRRYQSAIGASNQRGRQDDTSKAFKSLVEAQQHASHPQLADFMRSIRKVDVSDSVDGEIHDDDSTTKIRKWKESLAVDEAWRSSRINTLLEVFKKMEEHQDGLSVIFDKSYYSFPRI